MLTPAECAVLAGAKTLVAVHKCSAEADHEALSRHGIGPSDFLPSETTIRRALALVDAETFDRVVAAWMALSGWDRKFVGGQIQAVGSPR
ncbi:MAG: transposase family protein [Humibacillus sp.]|nr:transposase family protein [Humibacillus sp.]